MRPNKDWQNLWLWAALLLPLLWLAAGLAQITEQAHGLSALAAGLTALLNDPLSLRWCSSTPKFLLAVLVLYPLGVYCYLLDQANHRPGEEHGSAHWGNAGELNEHYRNRKDPWQEIILSQNVRLSNDSYQHQRNLHVVVIGGSGSGKTRFFIKPNLLQCDSKNFPVSFVVTDPKGSIGVECGEALLKHGYKLKFFNTINFSKSMRYNPMAYIHSEKDVLKLVTALMTNTKGEGQGGDPFWDKAERLLLVSLIAYLHYEAPVEEKNFATLLEMLNTMQVSEDDETYQNPVDLLFEDLGKKKPKSFAVRQYKLYKLAAGVT